MAHNLRMATKKPKGLGLGLEALLGPKVSDAPVGMAPTTLRLSQLHTGKYQPRTRMDEGSLYELAESIKSQGVMQPVLVRPMSGTGAGTGGGAAERLRDHRRRASRACRPAGRAG